MDQDNFTIERQRLMVRGYVFGKTEVQPAAVAEALPWPDHFSPSERERWTRALLASIGWSEAVLYEDGPAGTAGTRRRAWIETKKAEDGAEEGAA